MNKYVATLLLIAFFSPANAVDNFDANTGILTVPSVIIGDTTFRDVVVRLNDVTVLSYDPNPSVGLVLYENSQIRINLTGSSRTGHQTDGSSYVVFSVLITNKTASRIWVAGVKRDISSWGNEPPAASLTDEKGNICSLAHSFTNGISSLSKYESDNLDYFTVINAYGEKTANINTYEDSDFYYYDSRCGGRFKGITFNYDSSLWIYDGVTPKSLIPFSVTNVAIPN